MFMLVEPNSYSGLELSEKDVKLICFFLPEKMVNELSYYAERSGTGLAMGHVRLLMDDHEEELRQALVSEKQSWITKTPQS